MINAPWLSKGGKAAQALLTTEERQRRARKGARRMGKEARSAKAAKGWTPERRAAHSAKIKARAAARRDPGVDIGDLSKEGLAKIEIKKPTAGTLDRKVYDVLGLWRQGATVPMVRTYSQIVLSDLQVRSSFSTLRRKGFIERAGEIDGRAAYRVKS